MKRKIIIGALIGIWGCGSTQNTTQNTTAEKVEKAPSQSSQAVDEKLKAAIASQGRPTNEKLRDYSRHPYETLNFFGIRETMTVLELWPGSGWYTNILAPYLKDKGKLIAAITDPKGSHEMRKKYAQKFLTHIEENKEMLGPIETVVLSPPEKIGIVEKGSVDLVVTFRSCHNWHKDGQLENAMTFAFDALKPGGVFGVVQHRGVEGSDPSESAKKGYLPEIFVIKTATDAGFVLEEKTEINANPKDTKNYDNGVWELPPSLKGNEQVRDDRIAIGESDRMTLRFRKPLESKK